MEISAEGAVHVDHVQLFPVQLDYLELLFAEMSSSTQYEAQTLCLDPTWQASN